MLSSSPRRSLDALKRENIRSIQEFSTMPMLSIDTGLQADCGSMVQRLYFEAPGERGLKVVERK